VLRIVGLQLVRALKRAGREVFGINVDANDASLTRLKDFIEMKVRYRASARRGATHHRRHQAAWHYAIGAKCARPRWPAAGRGLAGERFVVHLKRRIAVVTHGEDLLDLFALVKVAEVAPRHRHKDERRFLLRGKRDGNAGHGQAGRHQTDHKLMHTSRRASLNKVLCHDEK
jgi:hypothetical protein